MVEGFETAGEREPVLYRSNRLQLPGPLNSTDNVYLQAPSVYPGDVDWMEVNWVFWSEITDRAVLEIIWYALERTSRDSIPALENKQTWLASDVEAKAILGIRPGIAASSFFAQHKATLGMRSITEVAVWATTSPYPKAFFAQL